MSLSVAVLFAGGFAVNQAISLEKAGYFDSSDNLDYMLFDGSDSNASKAMLDAGKALLVPGTTGQGKKRAKNVKQYLDFVAENVSRVPDADLYLIVYSLSGGSGSVLGPEMNRRLMSKGKNTINIVLSTDDSREDVKNTFNTLTGLANNVKQLNRPIHFMLEESSSGKRSDLDAMIQEHIVNASNICAHQHLGLDANDVNSWLDYQQHDIEPQLTMIERFDDTESLEQLNGSVITILSLLTDQDNTVPKVGAVFNTDGISTVNDKDVHFVTTTKNIDALRRKIEEEHKRYQSVAEGLNVKDSFGSSDMESNGMVY